MALCMLSITSLLASYSLGPLIAALARTVISAASVNRAFVNGVSVCAAVMGHDVVNEVEG
jgi:hypothetical protein